MTYDPNAPENRYPSWRYHPTKPPLVVRDPAHEAEAAHPKDGWCDSPATAAATLTGPTLEEFVAAGYAPKDYPPEGSPARPSPGLDAYKQQVAEAEQATAFLQGPEADVVQALTSVDHFGLLSVLQSVERATKNRKSILKAIQARMVVVNPPVSQEKEPA